MCLLTYRKGSESEGAGLVTTVMGLSGGGGCGASSQSSQHLTVSPSSSSSSSAAEGLLGGVDHVEEAVLVALLLVDLGDGRGHGHHAVLVDQQEEGLRGVQLQTAPGRKRRSKRALSWRLRPPGEDLLLCAHLMILTSSLMFT